MNKKFIYAALASLAMVGCAKTEGVKPVKQAETIAFRPTNTSVTRAETTTDNLDSFLSVGIDRTVSTTPSIYYGNPLTKPSAGGSWDTGAIWVAGDFLAFNIGPASNDGIISMSKSQVFVTPGVAAKNVKGQAEKAEDALFTVTANTDTKGTSVANYTQKEKVNDNRNINKGVDVVIGTVHDPYTSSNDGVLNLNFRHIYSQVLIKASNKKPSKYTVKVLGAGIAYVNSTGQFTFPTAATTTAKIIATSTKPTPGDNDPNNDPSWTSLATSVVYGNAWNITKILAPGGSDQPAEVKDPITLTDSPVEVLHPAAPKGQEANEEGFYLIPQVLTPYNKESAPNGTYLKVFVQISTVGGSVSSTQLFPKTPGKYGSVMVPINQIELLAGKKYVFVVNFFTKDTGGGGLSDPHPADNGTAKGNTGDKTRTGGGDPTTTEGNGLNPDIMDEPTNVPPGEQVINSKTIKFDVTVDQWDTTTDVISIDL